MRYQERSKRFRKALEMAGLSMFDVAAKTGINARTILSWQQGARRMPEDAAALIGEVLGVSQGYLLGIDPDDLVDFKAIQAWNGDKPVIALRKEWLQGRNLDAPVTYRISGNNMEPALRDGDVVLVDINVKSIEKEGIYLFDIAGNLKAMRVAMMPGKVVISSDNIHGDRIEISPDEARTTRTIGLVVCAWKLLSV